MTIRTKWPSESDIMADQGEERESLLLRDCGIIKDQIREVNGVIGEIASRLNPVRVLLPNTIPPDTTAKDVGPQLTPVAQELDEISVMLGQLKERLLHLTDEIRT